MPTITILHFLLTLVSIISPAAMAQFNISLLDLQTVLSCNEKPRRSHHDALIYICSLKTFLKRCMIQAMVHSAECRHIASRDVIKISANYVTRE